MTTFIVISTTGFVDLAHVLFSRNLFWRRASIAKPRGGSWRFLRDFLNKLHENLSFVSSKAPSRIVTSPDGCGGIYVTRSFKALVTLSYL